MAKLSAHQSGQFVKMIYVGDSGTGKTGSLVSLVAAGYTLKILDLDNGLDALKAFINRECPDKIDAVDFETIRDPIKASSHGPVVTAKALVRATELMTKWSDESDPGAMGEKGIFVLDSGTTLGKAAYEWARTQNPAAKEPRTWYFAAQQAYENLIALLTSSAFKSNVILITHVNYRELADGGLKGYPSAVGSALGPTIPKYFNTLVEAAVIGTGKHAKRVIRTIPTGTLDLKNPAPFSIDAEYPLGTGLASLFEKLKSA